MRVPVGELVALVREVSPSTRVADLGHLGRRLLEDRHAVRRLDERTWRPSRVPAGTFRAVIEGGRKDAIGYGFTPDEAAAAAAREHQARPPRPAPAPGGAMTRGLLLRFALFAFENSGRLYADRAESAPTALVSIRGGPRHTIVIDDRRLETTGEADERPVPAGIAHRVIAALHDDMGREPDLAGTIHAYLRHASRQAPA